MIDRAADLDRDDAVVEDESNVLKSVKVLETVELVLLDAMADLVEERMVVAAVEAEAKAVRAKLFIDTAVVVIAEAKVLTPLFRRVETPDAVDANVRGEEFTTAAAIVGCHTATAIADELGAVASTCISRSSARPVQVLFPDALVALTVREPTSSCPAPVEMRVEPFPLRITPMA